MGIISVGSSEEKQANDYNHTHSSEHSLIIH
jgi:hypothetical protein